MNKEHRMVIVPGIRDHITLVENFIGNRYPSMEVLIYRAQWARKDTSISFIEQGFKNFISNLAQEEGSPIAVVATSSSPSLVVNTYPEINPYVNKFVFVCGRLRGWGSRFDPLFKMAAVRNRLYCDSVQACEGNLSRLTNADRKKFMTMRPWFDLQVPPQTCVMEGARNIKIPMVGHVPSIAHALIFMNKEIAEFVSDR
ncbi:hypothetical protein M1437_01275 [Patescibacteria group bacterium]|nr:hypothetical protein [Patescibacteria group bacterium]